MARRATASTQIRTPSALAWRGLVVGGVLIASMLLLLGNGWGLIGRLVQHETGGGALAIAVLLNLALVMIGWRRYHDLAAAMRARDEEDGADRRRRDEVTDVLTRRAFAREAATMLRGVSRRDRAAAALVVDLDHFTTVNDLHGHLAGDTVLRGAADVIRRALPPAALLGRLDGDAFVVVLPFDPRHAGTVDALAEFMVGALAQPIVSRGVTARTGASIGVAGFEPGCRDIEGLLRRATMAMHAAKKAGRNRHVWFDATMERALIERSAIETGLREGIPQGRFVPYYEQQVDLDSGRPIGFEVAARWNHPDGSVLTPDLFVPVAEECSLTSDLSVAVMRRALIEARDWDASLTLSVSISPSQLRDPWLAQKIVKLLVETGFPANRLEIQIAESGLFQNPTLAQSIIGSLKNQGIRLALDDFGTGFSSLAHLRALPFDRIKIDRSMVAAMTGDPQGGAIVEAMMRLAESLDLPITAGGIEDGAVLARLAAIGCARGQGGHFGAPMPLAATRRLLAERGLLPSARASAAPAPDGGSVAEHRRIA